jgi:hypothetical protein
MRTRTYASPEFCTCVSDIANLQGFIWFSRKVIVFASVTVTVPRSMLTDWLMPHYCWAPKEKNKDRTGHLKLLQYNGGACEELKPRESESLNPQSPTDVTSNHVCRAAEGLEIWSTVSLQTYWYSEWGRCVWISSITATLSTTPYTISLLY